MFCFKLYLNLFSIDLSFNVFEVIECAKIGVKSYGVELNTWLLLYSKIRSRVLGVNRLTQFERKDLWKVCYLSNHCFDNNLIYFLINCLKNR